MDPAVIAALADLPSRHVDPRKRRQETRALIHVGMIGAQTASLAHLARARGSAGSRGPRPAAGCGDSSSTSACRRAGRRRWSRSSPAGVTRARMGCRWQAARSRARTGSTDWTGTTFPSPLWLARNRLITQPDGREVKLATQLTRPRKGRHGIGTLDGMDRPRHLAARLKGAEGVIVATTRPGHDALETCCKRGVIDTARPPARTGGARGLAANRRTRGFISRTPA